MIVDVIYQGLSLVKGAQAREEAGGAFIELELPMPVGTRLVVATPDGERQARVERVHEGASPGVVVRFGDEKSLGDPGSARTAAQVPHAKAPPVVNEPNAPMTEMKSAPPVVTIEAAPEEDEPSSPPENGNDEAPPTAEGEPGKKRRERRSKARKTVIGH